MHQVTFEGGESITNNWPTAEGGWVLFMVKLKPIYYENIRCQFQPEIKLTPIPCETWDYLGKKRALLINLQHKCFIIKHPCVK